ncbi:MAG: class I SAM-dependent methyltransferase [Halobacteriota archaeon]
MLLDNLRAVEEVGAMKVDLHGVEGTLLAPLWGRAKFSREYPSVFNDAKAIELVEQIDYDFSTIDEGLRFEGTLMLVARAKQFDDKARAYIAEHPTASVINLGAGLDTTLYRIDNGSIGWILISPTSSTSAANCSPNLTGRRTLQNRCSTRVGVGMSSTRKTGNS